MLAVTMCRTYTQAEHDRTLPRSDNRSDPNVSCLVLSNAFFVVQLSQMTIYCCVSWACDHRRQVSSIVSSLPAVLGISAQELHAKIETLKTLIDGTESELGTTVARQPTLLLADVDDRLREKVLSVCVRSNLFVPPMTLSDTRYVAEIVYLAAHGVLRLPKPLARKNCRVSTGLCGRENR